MFLLLTKKQNKMLEFLDILRSKSKHYRKMVAITTVSIITGLIFIVWAYNSLTRLSEANLEEASTEEVVSQLENSSALSSFKEQLENIVEEGMGIFDSFQGTIEYQSTTTEGL